eukprot:974409-Prymnesium_polylepis.1
MAACSQHVRAHCERPGGPFDAGRGQSHARSHGLPKSHVRRAKGHSEVCGGRVVPKLAWGPSRFSPPPLTYGLWPMVRRKAVLERYAILRCLWHEI